MTNEALVSYSRLTLDNTFKDPSLLDAGGRWDHVQRHLPGQFDQPVSADRPPPRVGRKRPGRAAVGEGQRRLRAQRRAAVQQQADEARRRARLEVRYRGRARAEAAEFPEPRSRPALVRRGQHHRHRPLGRGHARRAGGPVQPGDRPERESVAGDAVRRVPVLELRRVRPGQLEAALESHARVRRALRQLDATTKSSTASAAISPPRSTTRPRDRSWIRGRTSVSTASATWRPGARPTACWRTARPSRCRASTWPGTSTARATTSSAAATGCSTTATWATWSTTPRSAWHRTPTRSPRTSGRAAGTETAAASPTTRSARPRWPTASAASASSRSRPIRSSGRRRTASARRSPGGFRATRWSKPVTSARAAATC